MRTRIVTDLSRDDIASDVTDAINRAIKHYESEPFWFKETNDTFSTVASQKAYDSSDGVATDIEEIHYAEITLGDDFELTRRDMSWIEQRDNDNTGDPTVYALWQGEIWLYPTPNQVRTVTLYYTKSYAALSADADTNDWLTEAEDLIEARARWWLCKRKLKMFPQAQEAKLEELEALEALRKKNENRASQSIVPTRF